MSKFIIAFTIYMFISSAGFAKKRILPIELVAVKADIIAIGEIISAGSRTYDLEVDEYIKGERGKILRVPQFEEWTCDNRFAPIAKGQRLILFLQVHNGIFSIINGSTGEIPILNGWVVLQYEEYRHIPFKFNPYRLGLAEFKEGIRMLLECYSMPPTKNGIILTTLVQNCSDGGIHKFVTASKFTGWLYQKIKRTYVIAKA